MKQHHGIALMELGELLALLFTEYPELSVDVHRYLLMGQYAKNGQQHMFDTMCLATKTAEVAIEALKKAMVELDDYKDNRLGTQDITWVGPVTRKDGPFVSGYWRRL